VNFFVGGLGSVIAIELCLHPIKWGDIFFLALLSVCLHVRLSVHQAFMSALHVYLLIPLWDLQITLHQCQV